MERRMRLGIPACLVLSMLCLAAASNTVCAAGKQTLTAVYSKAAPAGLDDPLWTKIKPLEVPFDGKEKFAGKKTAVNARAAFTDTELYLWFNWKDATMSVTKEAWSFDGKAWTHLQGDEDRISLLFEINRINNFATKGCAVTCHVPPGAPNAKDGRFGTATDAEKGDLWHWKAARSDPAGYADDGQLVKISDTKGGRKADAGKGGDKQNMTADKSKPMYMLGPGKKLGKHGILLASDAVEITDYSAFKAGDVVTFRMPVAAEGSFGDIRAASRYADGAWTVVLSRKLDTGHDDDVIFNPQRKYSFAMALFDDSKDQDSYDSESLTLEFKK